MKRGETKEKKKCERIPGIDIILFHKPQDITAYLWIHQCAQCIFHSYSLNRFVDAITLLNIEVEIHFE